MRSSAVHVRGLQTAMLALGLAALAAARATDERPLIPRLRWTPRSDWENVRDHGARGDGVNDDTDAIQGVLDHAADGATVYIPAGHYRVTRTLARTGPRGGILVVGHGRDTRLVWDGAAGDSLLYDDGVAYSRFVGLVFDGRGRAAVGFRHTSTRRFETGVRHQHLAFLDVTDAGILVDPDDTYALAETLIENCLFQRCGRGIAFVSFNDCNYTFDGCEFRTCGTAIDCHHGNMSVRNTHFEASSGMDIRARTEHGCSVRRCTSIGSRTFLEFSNSVSPMPTRDCHVSGWADRDGAIRLSGAPAVVFDSGFSDPPDAAAPIRLGHPGQVLVTSGNRAGGADEPVSGPDLRRLGEIDLHLNHSATP